MAGINKVILLGRLGQDPEIRYLPDGTPVASFSLATSENWTDKNSGEKKENTEWHKIVAWRKLAEICAKYLVKGKQVYVEGKLKTEKWDKDGVTHYTTKVVIHEMQMLGDKSGSSPQTEDTPESDSGVKQYQEEKKTNYSGNYPKDDPPQKNDADGDVPF